MIFPLLFSFLSSGKKKPEPVPICRHFRVERFLRVIGWLVLASVSAYTLVVELFIRPEHFVSTSALQDLVQFLGGGLMVGFGLAALAFAEHLERLRRIEQALKAMADARLERIAGPLDAWRD